MIQTYSLGTAVTRIDGANIATGTINAQDAILQGSLTADRINATSIQASTLLIPAIVNGINGGVGGTWIDGGSIRTGTVDTNRLNVTGVIQAINSEGSTTINGGKISTGTITVGHLTADSLSAGKIKASLLDVNGMIQIVNGGSITKLTGGGIATGTIDATKLVLKPGGMGTINLDPMLQDASLWRCGLGSFTFESVNDAPVGNRVIRTTPNVATIVNDNTWYPVDTAKRYRLRFWARRSADANGTLYACLRQFNSSLGVCATNGGRSPYKPCAVTPSTSWTEYSFEWGPGDWQSGVKFVQLDWLLHHQATAGYVEMCYPRFEEMVNAELIVDGAVTANTIRTGEFYSQGTGGTYGSFNPATGIATGFKLAHTPFNANNVWGRSQSVQAEFGNNVLVKGYPLGPALGIALSGFDIPPLDQLSSTDIIFYRGNNNPADERYGVPKIANTDANPAGSPRLLVNTAAVVTNTSTVLHFQVQPLTNQDNLDALSHLEVVFWSRDGATLSLLGQGAWVPISSRRYKVVATPSDPGNAGHGMYTFTDYNTIGLIGATRQLYMQVKICNVYGDSTQHWFEPPSAAGNGNTSATGRWTDIGTVAPSGTTGGSTGTPPSLGSGGGGGGCVPAGTPFLTQHGWLPVESIAEGMAVVGYDEATLQPINTTITRVYRYDGRALVRVVTDRGDLVCSHDHRLALVTGSQSFEYPAARDLTLGDLILFRKPNGKVTEACVKEVVDLNTNATVYHCTLDTGHVYVAGDFLAHNIVKIPFDRDVP